MKPIHRLTALVIAAHLCLAATATGAPKGPDGPFDRRPEAPRGKLNPDAPEELRQFEFMVGEFDCVDRLLQRDGTWLELPATWHGSYFLNGQGIIDRYWNGRFATSNTRVFDPAKDRWMVTFFKMPGYSSGTWEGQKESDDMVMKQESKQADGSVAVSRLTFYDITPRSYEWKSERVVDGKVVSSSWTSSCKRRRE